MDGYNYGIAARKRLAFVVNIDSFFISHRLPLALHAIQNGWDVFLLTKNSGRKEELEKKGIHVYDIPFGRTSVNPVQELRCMLKIVQIFRRIHPDVIHNVTWKGCLWGSISAKIVRNKHVVNALSGLGSVVIHNGIISKIMMRLAKIAFKDDSSIFIFQNPDDIQWFKTRGFAPDDRIRLIKGSGIDLQLYSFHETIPKDKLQILFPARILKDKGLFELIEAMNILRPKYEGKIELIIAGNCGDANKTSISEAELKTMLLDGFISWIGNQKNMYPVYVKSDIVVLPSYREGLPKSLIEACAVGRPIVTTNVPGCKECVDDEVNGYLVPAKSAFELAEAINKLIANQEKRKKFGIASRKKAEQEFSIENVIDKTFSIYNSFSFSDFSNDKRTDSVHNEK